MQPLHEIDLAWFDKKYQSGKKPTLEDRAHLLSLLTIPFSERTKERIEEYLKAVLFEFNRNVPYRQSIHVLAYALLFDLAPILRLDRQAYQKYIALYRQAEARHQEAISLKRNFE